MHGHGSMLPVMKTFLYRQALSLDDLAEVDRPVPSPGPRELLVRVHAVSLNYRDLAIARGTYGGCAVPLVPLSDASGEVVAVGSEARRFAVGDRVVPAYVPDWFDGPVRADVARRRLGGPTDGVLAEYVCVHDDAAVRAPRHLSHEAASTLPIAGASVWQALVADAGLRAGDVVGISGTGGASLFAVQIAAAVGARSIVVARDADKLARVEAIGATIVDSSREHAWERRVLELTAGAGVDVFLDVVGGDALARSIAATRVGGTVSAFGFAGGTSAALDMVSFIRRAVTVRATSGGSRASLDALARALEDAGTEPIVDRVFGSSLAEVRAAFHHLAEHRPFGKVVIAMRRER
jgi:NADPH:quinone reductase-like Zn-dependent oxidoreductase